MYEAKRFWKYGGNMVPPVIPEFEESFLEDWLDRSSRPTDLHLYHYTTAGGLKGIVEDKGIRCSEIGYLNDAQEVEHSLRLIRTKIEELREEHSDNEAISKGLLEGILTHLNSFPGGVFRVFVACFCKSGDLLSQWRGYAEEGGGYSLEFTFNDQTKLILEDGQRSHPYLRKVLYDEDRQEELVETYLAGICDTLSEKLSGFTPQDQQIMASSTALHVMNTLMDWVVSFKHHGFQEENEWRLVRMLKSMDEAKSQAQFRVSNGLVVPYVDTPLVKTKEKSGEETEAQEYFPLSNVRYGPTLPADRAESSITSLLETHSQRGEISIDVNEVSIESPEVPFRG
jgi:hypothetical protein